MRNSWSVTRRSLLGMAGLGVAALGLRPTRVGAAPAPLHAHYVLMRAAIMQSRPIPGSLPGEEAARRRILAQAVRTALSAG